ncbi:hypothetical protein L3Q82_005145 [Scortum barcoo]|uniref:Uncharacterized protein n=1 Tax=Scortum barcoo TaxID=214431 RepID=A0ACB8VER2_9TELE|nr:hypothetical protein L3Q82_005145 [Scortum barcoo]
MLSLDRNLINTNISSFISALCLMFGSYYCFNIHYPSELASTLEFLQRRDFTVNQFTYFISKVIYCAAVFFTGILWCHICIAEGSFRQTAESSTTGPAALEMMLHRWIGHLLLLAGKQRWLVAQRRLKRPDSCDQSKPRKATPNPQANVPPSSANLTASSSLFPMPLMGKASGGTIDDCRLTAMYIPMDPAKVSIVADWPTPNSCKQLQWFLDFTSFYQRFIQLTGMVATPLMEMNSSSAVLVVICYRLGFSVPQGPVYIHPHPPIARPRERVCGGGCSSALPTVSPRLETQLMDLLLQTTDHGREKLTLFTGAPQLVIMKLQDTKGDTNVGILDYMTGKRKRDNDSQELLQYLERADERVPTVQQGHERRLTPEDGRKHQRFAWADGADGRALMEGQANK